MVKQPGYTVDEQKFESLSKEIFSTPLLSVKRALKSRWLRVTVHAQKTRNAYRIYVQNVTDSTHLKDQEKKMTITHSLIFEEETW
jgi:hypothetical protein